MRARRILAVVLLAAFAAPAQAAYPEKPIRFVVPSAPGGSVDVLMRILTQQLSAQMGVAFVPGTMDIVKAAPDGYTLGYGNIVSLAVNPHAAARAAVRRGEGPHAGVELRAGVQYARGEQRPAGAHGGGADRLREEEPGEALERLVGERHDGTPGRRAVQGDDRDGDGARAVQRQRAGDQRSRRGQYRGDVRQRALHRAAREVGPRARAGGVGAEARGAVPGPADDRGGGGAGLRDQFLGWRDRARASFQRGYFEIACRDKKSPGSPRSGRALPAARHRARRRRVGGVSRAGAARDAEVGRGDPALGREGRLDEIRASDPQCDGDRRHARAALRSRYR